MPTRGTTDPGQPEPVHGFSILRLMALSSRFRARFFPITYRRVGRGCRSREPMRLPNKLGERLRRSYSEAEEERRMVRGQPAGSESRNFR